MAESDAEAKKIQEENELKEQEEKLSNMGITGIKKYFLAVLFLFIVVSSLFVIYISTAALIYSIVPTLIISVVSLMPTVFYGQFTTTAVAVAKNFAAFGVLIVYFPIFTLFIWILWTSFFSFFKNMWKNLNFNYLFKGIATNLEQGSSYCGVAFQYFMFTVLFIVIDVLFFADPLGIITVIYGVLPVLAGFWKLIKHAWLSIFSKESDESVQASSEAASEDDNWYKLSDCCCCRCCCCKGCINKSGNAVAIPKSLLDPAELRFMPEFHAFIDDPNCNPFIHLKWNKRMIPGFIVLIYSIYLIIYGFIAGKILFAVAAIILLPLLVIFNIYSLFLPKENYENKGILRICMIIIGILYIIGVVLVLCAAIAEAAYNPATSPIINYREPDKAEEGYFTNNPAPFCSMNIHGFSPIQAASLLLLPSQIFTLSESKFTHNINEIQKYININGLKYDYNYTHNGKRAFNLFFVLKEYNLFYILGGNDIVLHWLLSLESIVYQYMNMIVGFVVPFFNVVYTLSKAPFKYFDSIIQSMTFQIPVVDIFAEDYRNDLLDLYNIFNENFTITLIGQGIGATIAKRVVSEVSLSRIDGIVYDGFSPTNSYHCSHKSCVPSKYLYNVISSVVIGSEEKEWTFNHKINGKVVFPKASDAFCMTAAMCSPDNRYVSLCSQLGVSLEKYYKWIPEPNITI